LLLLLLLLPWLHVCGEVLLQRPQAHSMLVTSKCLPQMIRTAHRTPDISNDTL
jgi:hypothetical protein